jgi:hypothetical protein
MKPAPNRPERIRARLRALTEARKEARRTLRREAAAALYLIRDAKTNALGTIANIAKIRGVPLTLAARRATKRVARTFCAVIVALMLLSWIAVVTEHYAPLAIYLPLAALFTAVGIILELRAR